MGDFFNRKKINKPKFEEFDLTKESDLEACGLEKKGESFINRNNSFFESLKKHMNVESPDNPVGAVAKQLEDHFSTREISFLLAKSILIQGLREQQNTDKKMNKLTKSASPVTRGSRS